MNACTHKKTLVSKCHNDSSLFPQYCSIKVDNHVLAIATMISVGSHTIVQSEEPQSEKSSASHVGKCHNDIGRFPHTCSIQYKNLIL